ncbi:DUF924 family protein [Enterobacter ludwigii]|uniref:DUF924 family protein n=1 Tax=Enterobacter ludwigii TaxID=299767 RepID=UPI00234D3D4F|nr:DUF924 family protein [Enterobacter ludwigii]MDC7314549.1 DUF924 domain-containing protein [Enterobacter ludwigii]MDI0401502.1 DUF924 family protein [Enterobacter ludwigii]MDI0411863.1 DUF924 family protein [Enterobacter ludwigii]MDI0416514.1 DUF924 family protein [Enterobacter ludwigii]MDI0429008.1 DUF924 family protein [Enterobacter ludwigii]
MNYRTVLDFWFSEQSQTKWFERDDNFDAIISDRFTTCWQMACRGELSHWRENILGRLAEIIVLDQFSRNLNRENAHAWAQDGMAMILSQEAILKPEWHQLSVMQRAFLLMPWMHSESAAIHDKATLLFNELGDPSFMQHEQEHRSIILQFGRYPHRNRLLGRTSTTAEKTYLSEN